MSNRKSGPLIESLVREMRRFIANVILTNQQIADRHGLNLTDSQTLNLLDLRGSATPGELTRLTGLTSGGVTVVLDRLEAAGYVKRERNPLDRRSIIVCAVPAKLRQLERSYRSVNEQVDQLLGGYDARELKVVLKFFERTNGIRR